MTDPLRTDGSTRREPQPIEPELIRLWLDRYHAGEIPSRAVAEFAPKYISALLSLVEQRDAQLLALRQQLGRCECGGKMTVCADCAVADYQAAHSDCSTCCPPVAPLPREMPQEPRIQEIRERLDHITPGPWKADPTPTGRCDGIYAVRDHNHPPEIECWDAAENCPAYEARHGEIVTTDSGYYGPKWNDALFIAHAPEDIAYLLELVAARLPAPHPEEKEQQLAEAMRVLQLCASAECCDTDWCPWPGGQESQWCSRCIAREFVQSRDLPDAAPHGCPPEKETL